MLKGKLTVKQEAFCRAYVETGNATEAYARTISTKTTSSRRTLTVMAHHYIANNPVVADRINELMDEVHEDWRESLKSITLELNENRALAISLGQISAANQSTLGKAKLHGLDKDRVEISGPGGGPVLTLDPSKLSTEALREILAATKDDEPDFDEASDPDDV